MSLLSVKRRQMLWLSASLICGLVFGAVLLPALITHKTADTVKEMTIIQPPAPVAPSKDSTLLNENEQSTPDSEAAEESSPEPATADSTTSVTTPAGNGVQPVAVSSADKPKTTFSIQVGSFSSRANADIMVDLMKARGYKAVTVIPDGTSTKVLVGSYSDRNTAASEAEKLQQSGCPAFVKSK
ncbi:MAG: SPOR domain-containing protein [bacterium]|nr:SPOR domain-containing protein [bacterium]